MSRTFLFFLFFLSLILIIFSGCAEQECKKPFSKLGSRCCIDLDENQKCDIDEQDESQDNLIAENTDAKKISAETPAPLPETKESAEPAVKIEPKSQITGNAAAEIKQEEPKPATITTTPAQEINDITQSEEEKPTVSIESPESQSKTQKFMDMYKAMIKGYRYIYMTQTHKVNGDKIKIELSVPKKYRAMQINGKNYSIFYIDTVYLDKRKQTAKGYCEKDAACYEDELFDVPLQLNYDDFNEKIPHEWLYDYALLEPNIYEELKYYVKGRLTTRATYLITNGEIRIYYDPKIGLPIRIEKQINPYPPEIIEYFDLAAELIEPNDVIHISRNDISPEDIFYTTRS